MTVVAFPNPQLAPVGVALVGLAVPVAAVLAALDSQQAPVGVALACRWWCLEKVNTGIMVLLPTGLH